jgi:cytochrome c-type biogenesis protein CcmH/NrfG
MKLFMNEPGTKRGFTVGVVLVLAVIAGVIGYSMGSKKEGAPASAFGHGPEHESGDPRTAAGQGGPPSLEALLPQLERKVAANPKDIDQRLLLAQTYNEVGQREQGLKTLRAVHRDVPGNTTATIMLATMLMIGNDPKELQESFTLLDEAVRTRPALEVMARLYQGDIRQRLGDPAGAKKIWSEQLAKMPAGDQRRAMYENKLAGR